MAREMVSLFIGFGLCGAAAVLAMENGRANATVPAIFVFGDSIFDVGNNNFLPYTSARADQPHNGIDFPGGVATGRFSNGYNIIDYLAMNMGFEMSPEAFMSLVNTSTLQVKMSKGVNFASGGSGILDCTGILLGGAFPLTTQIENFATVQSNLNKRIGSEKATILLSKSIFVFSTGNCDLLEREVWWHGRLQNSTRNELFLANLTSKFKLHLQELYQLGARKFGVIGLPAVGCCPMERSDSDGKCSEDMNGLAHSFNRATAAMLVQLKGELDGMSYSLGNITSDSSLLCTPNDTYCSNHEEYVFWDLYHPTQKAASFVANALFNGSSDLVAPINFQQLAES
ncbi:hypothetical protein ACLOJK_002297 [Asimina triloba]